MALVLDLKLLLLIAIANGVPVLARAVLGHRLSHPVDFGVTWPNGEPLLGHAKSYRGIVLSMLGTAAAAPFLGLGWRMGLLIAVLAMTGDLVSSFLKRRMKLPASSMALGLDQLPESLLPLVGCAFFLPLSAEDIVAVVAAFFVLELGLSRLLYRVHLRDRPY